MTSLTTLLALMKHRPKSAAVKNIADILSQKYRYRIDISKGDIDPPLTSPLLSRSICSFYGAMRMHTAVYALERCLSVCLFVRLSHAVIVSKRLKYHQTFFTIE